MNSSTGFTHQTGDQLFTTVVSYLNESSLLVSFFHQKKSVSRERMGAKQAILIRMKLSFEQNTTVTHVDCVLHQTYHLNNEKRFNLAFGVILKSPICPMSRWFYRRRISNSPTDVGRLVLASAERAAIQFRQKTSNPFALWQKQLFRTT